MTLSRKSPMQHKAAQKAGGWRSLAMLRIFGRKYGYIPSRRRSFALERIRRQEMRPDYMAATLLLAQFIEKGRAR